MFCEAIVGIFLCKFSCSLLILSFPVQGVWRNLLGSCSGRAPFSFNFFSVNTRHWCFGSWLLTHELFFLYWQDYEWCFFWELKSQEAFFRIFSWLFFWSSHEIIIKSPDALTCTYVLSYMKGILNDTDSDMNVTRKYNTTSSYHHCIFAVTHSNQLSDDT
jgi:hypothetical protein